MWLVYKYTFPDNKVYIGRSKNWKSRARTGYDGTLVGDAIQKYGWENVKKEILAEADNVEDADSLEKYYIAKYNSTDIACGYNMTKGGTGGQAVLAYRKPMSEDTRRKIGEKNRINMLGKHPSEETRQKLSQSLMGHEVTQETREKLRKANTGKHHSEETKRKIGEISRNMSDATRDRIRQAMLDTGAQRAEKRKQTITERYPEGLKMSKESNRKRSESLRGIKKSEEHRQHMRKPKSEEQRQNMIRAQRLRREAERLGLTYQEYKSMCTDK